MELMIERAILPDRVKVAAGEAVRRLAAVEAAVHGCAVEHIHFHEVGAVDTLVDIVGTLALVRGLGRGRVTVGTIPVGGGTVEIAHGHMGVPAPATIRLLEGYDIVGGPEMRELTTPTGALLLQQLRAQQGPLPAMNGTAVGHGAGSMRMEHGPNVLRALVGLGRDVAASPLAEGKEGIQGDKVVELQTNLDDVSAEVVAHTIATLWEAGALDVWLVPAHMKKGRSGVVLHALVEAEREMVVADAIFKQSGTLGIRHQSVSRLVAVRGTVHVTVSDLQVRVKWGRWRGRLVSVSPEYEDVAVVAKETGLPLREVMHLAAQAARELL
jgi:uncharacterized protein (TIGR00299 family) protein